MRGGRIRPFDVFIAAALLAALRVLALPIERGGGDGGPTFPVKKHKNITYFVGKDADARRHRLDVYQPEGKTGAPVLIYVHGGTWRFGSKMFRSNVGKTFARRGFVTVCINYRLSPRVKHPAHVRDVAHAFDWVKRNISRYGGDPERVFLSGHSAGGHLAALLALNGKYLTALGRTPADIAGVIGISGLYRVGATGNFEGVFDPDPEVLKDASPALHVSSRQPPFLILYAENDLPLLDMQAIDLETQLKEHNSPVTRLVIPERNHVNITHKIGSRGDPTTAAMLDFLEKHSRSAGN